MLLGSPPDMVHGNPPHRTRCSACRAVHFMLCLLYRYDPVSAIYYTTSRQKKQLFFPRQIVRRFLPVFYKVVRAKGKSRRIKSVLQKSALPVKQCAFAFQNNPPGVRFLPNAYG
jgi:hypothetical protein